MSESPFGPAESINKRELKFYEKLYYTAVQKCDEFYVAAIPSDDVKSMPPRYKYILGGFILVILGGVFFGVFLPSYLSAIDQKFLVPGSSSSKYCEEVSISNSGDYLATQDGNWIGGDGFVYSKAAYVFSIQNLDDTPSQYSEFMNEFYEILQWNGEILETLDLGVNLLYWMAYTLASNYTSNIRFYFTGNPVIVFNRQITVGSVSNIDYDCDLVSSTSFDQANGVFNLVYDYDEYVSNPTCYEVLSPEVFAYSNLTSPNILSIKLDVRSLISALGVNYGILDVEALQEIDASKAQVLFNGTMFNASSYTNPTFPGMDPIYCLDYEGDVRCVVESGAVVGLPYFNHMGEDPEFPSPCNCSSLTQEELDDKYDNCNLFNLLSGVILYNSLSPIPIFEMAIKYDAGISDLYAYNPSFIGSKWGKTSPYYHDLFNIPSTREELYEFCYIEGYGYCSLIIFSSFDNYNQNWAISDYYYSIPTGACRDTVTSTYDAWQELIDTPYAPLTQSYSECRNSPTTVLLNQAGVAVGNVSLLSPFSVLFVLILIGLYQRMTGFAIPKTYSRSEKDSAIDALAVALLKARDEKRKQKINPDHKVMQTLVTQLVDELVAIAETDEGTYYKQEEIEKFEVNWSEVVRSPFKPRSKSRDVSMSGHNSVELSNIEAPPDKASKVVFQKKVNLTAQQRYPDLLILNEPSTGFKITPLIAIRLSDLTGSNSDRLTSSSVRAQLNAMKNDTNIEILYTQTMEALDNLINYCKQNHPTKSNGHKLNKNIKLSIPSEFAELSNKTSVLSNIEALTRFQEIVTLNEADRDEDDEEVDTVSASSTANLSKLIVNIYKKIYALISLHAGIVLHCDDVGAVSAAYGDKIAYSVNNEVCTMNELKSVY